MRSLWLLLAVLPGCAEVRLAAPTSVRSAAPSADEIAVIAAVQRVFDGMAARDTTVLKAAFVPDGTLAVVDSTGSVDVLPALPWTRSVALAPAPIYERMVAPQVHVDGPMATLWTYYTLHLGERFLHCGTDAAVLVKQADGWKVQHLAFTARTTGCTPPTR